MKFHNQRSFMGHEISNVNNKPLLHKKGKQWIVVAVSALILAGFGGMVSTTTHADTTVQPATTKVAPKPANNSGNASNVMKQAQDMHKALANNVAVQKPSAPSSVSAKKTAPASVASTTSAKSNSVSASSSASSKASSSVNSASAKSSSVSSNSNSSNNKATKPAVHMMLMSTPAPSVQSGTWGTAHWTLNNGNLTLTHGIIQDGKLPTGLRTSDITSITTYKSSPVTYYLEGNIGQFANAYQNTTAQADTSGTGFGSIAHFRNLRSIDFSGMNFEHDPSIQNSDQLFNPLTNGGGGGADYPSMKAMFAGDTNLSTVKGLHVSPATHLVDMSGMFADCPALSDLDLSQVYTPKLAFIGNIFHGDTGLRSVNMSNINTIDITKKNASNSSWGFENMFTGTHIQSLKLGPSTKLSGNTGITNNGDWIKINNGKASLLTNTDVTSNGFASSGTWQPTEASGTWNNASWAIDNNGDLVLQDGQITNNRSDAKEANGTNLNWSNVKHIYTNNLTATTLQPENSNSNGLNHYGVFDHLPNLQSADLSGINASNITDVSNIFQHDPKLSDIKWNSTFNNVQQLGASFSSDTSLKHLDLSAFINNDCHNWWISDVPNLRTVTFGSGPLISWSGSFSVVSNPNNPKDVIYLGDNQAHQGTWNVTDYTGGKWGTATWAFDSKTGTLYLSNGSMNTDDPNSHGIPWNNVKNIETYSVKAPNTMSNLFARISSLQSVNLSGMNTSDVKAMDSLFCSDDGLTNVDLGNIDTSTVTNMNDMFSHSHYIKSINLGDKFNTSNVTTMDRMFNSDSDLQSLTLPSTFDTSNVVAHNGSMDFMFYQDTNLNQLTLPSAFKTNPSNSTGMFDNAHGIHTNPDFNLSTLNLGNEALNISSNQQEIPNDSWINIDSGNPKSLTFSELMESNQPHPGTWIRNAEILEYKYNGNIKGTQLITGPYNSTQSVGETPDGLPDNYYVENPSGKFTINGSIFTVNIKPNTDTINYQFNGEPEGSNTFTGSDTSNTSFTLSSGNALGMPSGYKLVNPTQSFDYDGGTYNVAVEPNEVNDTITFNNSNNNAVSSTLMTGLYGISGSVSAPSGYHFTNGSSTESFVYSNSSASFSVAPNTETENINYVYHKGNGTFSEGSTSMTGSYGAQGNIKSNSTSGLNPNYHLASSSYTFTYTNGTASDNVSVAPNTVLVNYEYKINNSNAISDGTAELTYNPNSQVSDDFDTPAGYTLAQPNSSIPFDKQGSNIDISVKPISKSDTIDYMYNGTQVGSTKINGTDMYANASTFDANSKVPVGYQAVDANNNFHYDGQTHDVNVLPNKDSDTVDYQANGKTLASQEFTGNDEHATQAGDNSFDVTAKNDSKIPSGYELVNSDNTFSFDNGTHDVAIQPMPAPAPFIPMSTNSESVTYNNSNSDNEQPVEVQPHPQPASHYRYAKVITPLQLHTSKHFTDKNGVLTIKHPTEFRIMRIVRDHKYTRYEVRYNHRNYFITANPKFTINDYVQKQDFKSRKHMMVRVITPLIEYKRSHFSKKYAIKVFKKGAVLPVKRVLPFGSGEMTRFQLTNGRYVTSNKLFVKVIK